MEVNLSGWTESASVANVAADEDNLSAEDSEPLSGTKGPQPV